MGTSGTPREHRQGNGGISKTEITSKGQVKKQKGKEKEVGVKFVF